MDFPLVDNTYMYKSYNSSYTLHGVGTGNRNGTGNKTRNDGFLHCYHPQRSCGKVMFLHLSVILITYTPWADTPWVDTPWTDTPPEMATAADSTHPTGMHSCAFNCARYTGTGTGRGNHCFLLYRSRSLALSQSQSCAVCMSQTYFPK